MFSVICAALNVQLPSSQGLDWLQHVTPLTDLTVIHLPILWLIQQRAGPPRQIALV
jgi:hypothetical protein